MVSSIFSQKDIEHIESLGMTLSEIQWQHEALTLGLPQIRLKRPCLPGDGVVILDGDERVGYARRFDEEIAKGRAAKFVPASGAGSRMFTFLHLLLDDPDLDADLLRLRAKEGDEDAAQAKRFFENLDNLALFEDLQQLLKHCGLDLESLRSSGQYGTIARVLLEEGGGNYASLPKALVPFHQYPEGPRTAFEEHLIEAERYAKDQTCMIRVHFTVSPGQEKHFRRQIEVFKRRYETPERRFEIGLSVQHRSTQTMTADIGGDPIRDRSGRLVFRPGGHGALLENLDRMEGDLVFIRTVDNVLPEDRWPTVCEHKKALGGLLVSIQAEIFGWLDQLRSDSIDERLLSDLESFTCEKLSARIPDGFRQGSLGDRTQHWQQILNRPLRVCGVVKHDGEPGGAPFWVDGAHGSDSLQLVEAAQVDLGSPEQQRIWESSTYFNPVFMICAVRGIDDRPFSLLDYRNPSTGFVSTKIRKGRPIRILEHPGLWNGGMAFWNTVFVEVPRSIFRPVKSILDLLD